ncbi:alpha/beta hydrolase [Muricoccus radiodurans]|uniref:alpha/beta hydrolase n=1 Tax=Muricoccus radiodurans TaxID=2231721 RepID=UPI003CF3E4AB
MVAAAIPAPAPAPVRAAPAEPVRLPRSRCWDLLASGDPARAHRLFLAWPEEPPPAGGYPLIVLLDANAAFATAVESLRSQARRPEATGVTPAILLGIGYPTEAPTDRAGRTRDYTPAVTGAPAGTGGADAFLDFVERELLPAVETEFPVDRARRAVFGHSLGGLLVLHTLFTRPGLFRRHAAASPSIWWEDRAVLRAAERFVAHPPPGAARLGLLLTVGELENGIVGADPARLARQRERRMGANARNLAAWLLTLGSRGPQVSFVEFAGENHASVVPAALSRALRFSLEPSV